MFLEAHDYIVKVPLTGDLLRDAECLMTENGKAKTFLHMKAVADVSRGLARQFGLDEEKCFWAGLLHDVSAVAAPRDMLRYAGMHGMALCEAELRYPFLLHQRLSKCVCEEYFGIADPEILAPVACHTTLKAGADPYDMVLFIADKLAWDQEGVPPFYDAVTKALDVSLEEACYVYMDYMQQSGKLLFPHTNWTAAFLWLQNRI